LRNIRMAALRWIKVLGICAGIILYLTPAYGGEPVTVLRVIDGDTIRVEYSGLRESVRLIGIDCPESKNNRKARTDAGRSGEDVEKIMAMGKRAADFVKKIVKPGDILQLEFDVKERNHYRRLLAYVFLEDGRMLNEVIIREGYASPMTIPPNVKYQEKFRDAYREAREAKRGLWMETGF
jgi:micrococcal nuclease